MCEEMAIITVFGQLTLCLLLLDYIRDTEVAFRLKHYRAIWIRCHKSGKTLAIMHYKR